MKAQLIDKEGVIIDFDLPEPHYTKQGRQVIPKWPERLKIGWKDPKTGHVKKRLFIRFSSKSDCIYYSEEINHGLKFTG